jgi:hypothetical protein
VASRCVCEGRCEGCVIVAAEVAYEPVPLMLDTLVDQVFACGDDRRGLVSDG